MPDLSLLRFTSAQVVELLSRKVSYPGLGRGRWS